MEKQKLYLVDATAFCYRAYFAIRDLSTSCGQPTNAIFGFVNMFNKLLNSQRPDFLAVCFDVSRKTFRREKFAEYKAQRQAMPEGLTAQIPIIKDIISAYNLRILELEGFEADDIIATLAKKAISSGFEVFIVSSDKDMLQLVNKDTRVFNPYREEGIIYDTALVEEKFGVKPERMVDVVGLMGDAVDNIPRVPGIGEKTAIELIRQFGTIDNLLANTTRLKSEKIRKAVSEYSEQIKLNRDLAILNSDVPVEFSLDDLKVGKPDYGQLFELFKRLEFKTLLKDLPLLRKEQRDFSVHFFNKKEKLEDILSGDIELTVSIQTKGSSALDSQVIGFSFCYQEDQVWEASVFEDNLLSLLSNAKIKKVGHNLKNLKLILKNQGVLFEGIHFDTAVAGYLLNPTNQDYSLSDLTWEYLDESFNNKLNRSQEAYLIWRLKPILHEKLKERFLDNLFYRIEMPLVEVLSEMEFFGVKIDIDILSKLSKELKAKISKLITQIYEIGGCEFNLNSPKQLRQVLFDKLKLPIIKKTKSGPSTDGEVLKKLESHHKIIAHILEYRQLVKLKSTYIDALPKLVNPKTGKIHASFNQTGTETGRLSSSQPNLQNIPIKTDLGRKIREAFIPSRKEDFIISADYSQIELRILAHLSGDDNLIKAFRNDEDIHRLTASLIYSVELDTVNDDMREIAKRINFGIIYGMSAFGLAKDLEIPQEEAATFIEEYFMRYPKVKEYIDKQIKLARKQGYVTTLLGRRRYLPGINSENINIRQFSERQAINTPIQGTAADLIKLAMINIFQQFKKEQLKTKMILQVHDELVFEVPKEEIEIIKDLLSTEMESVFKLVVPIKLDIKIGRNWSLNEATT